LRINIIGLGVGNDKSPETIESGPRWGVNEVILSRPVDVTFDMHDIPAILSGVKKQKRRTLEKLKHQLEKIKETNTLLYSLQVWPGLSNMAYPIKAVAKRFNATYFTGSIDYAMALALYKGCDEIYLYGANYHGSHDYRYQFGGVHYWIGRAEQLGVKVVPQSHSRVMNSGVYGYDMTQGKFKEWAGL